MLTEKSAGVSEGSDLRVSHAGEQSHQGGEEVLVIDQAIPAGVDQDPSKLTQAGFDPLQLGAGGGQRVHHRVLENQIKQKETEEIR